jgi:hypothetical protein
MDLEGVTGLVVYLVLKFGGYTLWAYVGLRWLSAVRGAARRAVTLGLLRLVIGWVAGLAVAPFVIVAGTDRIPLVYFTVLAIVRWFEWGVIALWLPAPPDGSRARFVLGGSSRQVTWRLCGIGVSYLADMPFLIAGGGFPRGRLLC